MLLAKDDIETVIPQRKPFVMLTSLLEASPQGFVSELDVTADNLFLKGEILQEGALVENIAQTCAAGFGYLHRQAGIGPSLGFIGAVTKLKVYKLPVVNSKISTKVVVGHQLENVYLVKGSNFIGEELLLECELKIVIT